MEYQFYQSRIEKLKKMGFKINWELIYLGYYGNSIIPCSQISKKEIKEYANTLIEKSFEQFDLITDLVFEIDNDYMLREILNKLKKNETVSEKLQERKWRVLIVSESLENIKDDYLEGLFELNELWVSLGIPNDSPHIFQGRNNLLTPQEYYTKEMFEKLYALNKEWLQTEINSIVSTDI